MHSFSFDGIGTRWEIETDPPPTPALTSRVLDCVETFDATLSRFRHDTPVAAAARAPQGGEFAFPPGTARLFDLYDQLHTITDGAIDPLVGRDLERLGYGTDYGLQPAPWVEPAATGRLRWSRDVVRDGSTLRTRCPLVIDVGAAGKGYLVDLVFGMLAAAGLERIIVDASGDMRHLGPEPVRVGLEHPLDPTLAIGIVDLRDRALCASATNRRAWGEGLHHVIDGRNGMPTEGIVATWALADDAMTADGLATALFFTSLGRLNDKFDATLVRMRADGRVEASADFDGELFVRREEHTT